MCDRRRYPLKPALRKWFVAGVCGVLLEVFAVTGSGAIRVWDGGAVSNADWTVGANWSSILILKLPPAPGDSLTFPAGAAQLVNTNSYTAGTGFGAVTWSGAGYSAYGNSLV